MPALNLCLEAIALRPGDGSGRALWAVASSKLTGRTWDGHVVLVPEPEQLQPDGQGNVNVTESSDHVKLNTESGNTDIAWLTRNVLLVTNDRGQLQLLNVQDDENLSIRLEASLTQHDDSVAALAVSPVNPTRVATAAWDGTYALYKHQRIDGISLRRRCFDTSLALVKLWTLDANDFQRVSPAVVLKGHQKPVLQDVEWHTTDEAVLASAGDDRHIIVWDARQRSVASTAQGPAAGVALAWSRTTPANLFVGNQAGQVLMYDTRSFTSPVTTIDPKERRPRVVHRVIELAQYDGIFSLAGRHN